MLHIIIAFPKITFKIIHRKLSGKNENFTLKILNYTLEYLIYVKCCSPFTLLFESKVNVLAAILKVEGKEVK